MGEERNKVLNEWATQVSYPTPGEVGLDVTQFGYPVGDFCWMTFDEVDRRLEWRTMHKFIQINRATWEIDANNKSPRPVRSTPEKIVIDVTGTALAPFYGSLHGQLTHENGRWILTGAPAHVSDGIQHALDAGSVDIHAALWPQSVDIHAALVPQKALTA